MKKEKVNISGVSHHYVNSVSLPNDKEKDKTFLSLKDKRIGISVSDSEDYKQLGFAETHQRDIILELTRYLLINGAHLIYGGDLRKNGYTCYFSDLSFQYRNKQDDSQQYFTNYFGWPIYNQLQNSDEAEFKKNRVELKKAGIPKRLPKELERKFIEPDSIENKLFWAESMTIMREEMVNDTDAGVYVGGTLSEYKGFYPGIIEEGFMMLKLKKPMYLVGAFGGATNCMIRALTGTSETQLSTEVLERFPALSNLYKTKKNANKALMNVFLEFKNTGLSGISKLNGLSMEENEILFQTIHFHEIIYYILSGLKRKFN